MRQILPLKGYNSLKALNAFHSLLLGLKMLPDYMALSYPEFHASFDKKNDREKEDALRSAVAFVQLGPEEVSALISFATDGNGVPYGASNQSNLGPDEIFEIIVAVCMEIGRIKIDLLTTEEKKK